MQDLVARHYRISFGILLTAIVILAFYVGMLEGKRVGGSSVVLSCTDEMLATQRISNQSQEVVGATTTPVVHPTGGMFAGSKNGTKYYSPGCAGLDRIKPENIIWFRDAQDAMLQGYTAGSC